MKTAFITGATSGIGFAMAKQLAEQGYQLILTGRSDDKLNQLRTQLPNVVHTIACDLSKQEDITRLISELKSLDTSIDVAINNAGFGLHGYQIELGIEATKEMLQVNINAVLELSHYFAETMTAQGSGYIMNVASTGAYQPQPLMSAYAASKAFVSSFTEGLALELKDQGVSVTVLSPGRTDTGFFSVNGQDMSSGGTFAAEKRASPEQVARLGLKAMFAGKLREIPLLENKFYVLLNRLLSRNMVVKMYHAAMLKV